MYESQHSQFLKLRTMVREISRRGAVYGLLTLVVLMAGCDPCMNNPCDNGLECDGLETCSADGGTFNCTDGTTVACEFPTFCTEPDAACVDPCEGADCDDGLACTTDTCTTMSDGTTECVNDPRCDDADDCTENDFCGELDDVCAGTAIVCPPDQICDAGICGSDPCFEVVCSADETCSGGVCVFDLCAGAVCDDGDSCTVDSCDSATGDCLSNPLCDDGDDCTTDTCDAGVCSFEQTVCDAGFTCNSSTGQCEASSANVGVGLSETTVTFDHTVGSTECPQEFGSFVVTNTGDVATSYTTTVGDAPLSTDSASFSLEPGETRTVNVTFTCAQDTSFTGTITVTGEASGQSAMSTLEVTGNVG